MLVDKRMKDMEQGSSIVTEVVVSDDLCSAEVAVNWGEDVRAAHLLHAAIHIMEIVQADAQGSSLADDLRAITLFMRGRLAQTSECTGCSECTGEH